MSFLEDNLENCKIGFRGEDIVRDWFKGRKIPFMQVDIMFWYNNSWCLGEVKSQEKFKAPPFDGHGLPQWQIERRLKFFNDTGIVPYLIIYDLDEKCLYIQKMQTLLNTKYFKTKGKKPRVVFNLSSFKKINI